MYIIEDVIKSALNEDIGSGDITTDTLVDPDAKGKGKIVAKEVFVLAGVDVAKQVFEYLDHEIDFVSRYKDGDVIKTDENVLEIKGNLRSLLLGERTALNFLQHLSGISTCVRGYVDELKKQNVRLVDTRKTTPGLRVLEKYAVRIGKASNHRMGLYDGVLIKDNHIAVCKGITKAVELIRKRVSHLIKIEVEVSDLNGVKEALDADVDVIMLDNMDLCQIKEAVKIINGKAVVEVSGGVTKENLLSLAKTGVDIISSGALTHSARNIDMSMYITAC